MNSALTKKQGDQNAPSNAGFRCKPFNYLAYAFSNKRGQTTVFSIGKPWSVPVYFWCPVSENRGLSPFISGVYKDQKYYDRFADDVAEAMKTEIGMYCMSETNSNILMWSHYAKDHTGYCLEFEATSHTPVFGKAQKVNYSENYPAMDYFNTPSEKQVDLLFLTKYIDWIYEKEWRIIDHLSGPGLKGYPIELLKSVTFGMRMTEQNKRLIREWIARRGHQIALYQAVQDRNWYGVTAHAID